MNTIVLTDVEKDTLVQFLKDYSNELGNAGCNDFYLPNTDENWELIKTSAESCMDKDGAETITRPEDKSKRIFAHDLVVLDYLTKKIQGSL